MSIALSTGAGRAAIAALLAAFNGGSIRVFTGPQPATPDAAETGTLLGVFTIGAVDGSGLIFQAGTQQMFKPDGSVWAMRAVATGTAAWFRLAAPSDDGTLTNTQARVDGTIGIQSAPGDMVWDSTSINAGDFYTLDAFAYIIQPSPGI